MPDGGFRFDAFHLDPAERRLTRDGRTVDLTGRYFDALVLLVGEAGRLVTKDRFMDEVWRGVPVTDEALTQCIRSLRRALGDDAARPRFIETAPKHGYRFIAAVESAGAPAPAPSAAAAEPAAGPSAWARFFRQAEAAAVGGALAGVIGGLIYGLLIAGPGSPTGMRSGSVVMALTSITALTGLAGGAGVGLGAAAATFASRRARLWTVVGAGCGGLLVGAIVKLVGLDVFSLLFGRAPEAITGAPEGAVLGAATGLALALAGPLEARRAAALSIAVGAATGAVIALSGGRLMSGSLALLAADFPQSRLSLAPVGALFGDPGFGPLALTATAALEGALFVVCIVAAARFVRRRANA